MGLSKTFSGSSCKKRLGLHIITYSPRLLLRAAVMLRLRCAPVIAT
jgi:hypothetical protein